MARSPTRSIDPPRSFIGYAPLVCGSLSLVLSCIDTELAPAALVTDCAPPSDNLPNVVFITAGLGDSGVVRCSGIAVTRTLIVTALGCVTLPNQLADSDEVSPGSTGRRSGIVYHAGAPDVNDCDGPMAIEDGSFSTLYGSPLDPDVFNVYLASQRVNEIGHEVSEILRAPATRCSDGIALLQLPSGIGLESIPIRADPTPIDDEPVVLSYMSVASAFTLQRNDGVPAIVARATNDGTEAPRSVDLADTCPEQSGGGLFSSMTGALVGVLTTSLGSTDCQTPAGGSVIPLAPFRRMLIDAAFPEKLLVEGTIDGLYGRECESRQ